MRQNRDNIPRQPVTESITVHGVLGRLIDNPRTGERIIIRTSSPDILEFDLYLPPGAHVPGRHAHPQQVEQFTVVEGQLRFRIGRRSIVATAGDSVAVPKGVAHWFGNAGRGIAHARVAVQPALRMEDLLAEAATHQGLRPLPAFLLKFEGELAVPYVPQAVVRAIIAPLAWLARA